MSNPAAYLALVDDIDRLRGRLPRSQAGSQPQRLLLTLLGDYFLDAPDPIASAGLVGLLEEFGVTSAGARAALSRLARRGLLVASKTGRSTAYRLSSGAARLLREEAEHVFAFGAAERPWSGRWTVVAFSVPESERRTRGELRSRLRWLGFSALYDGVWISPHPPTERIDEALDDVGVSGSTVFLADIRHRPGALPLTSAWDLEKLASLYAAFLAEFGPLGRRTAAGEVGAGEGLMARTALMDRWRGLARLDPELPAELLPDDWPRTAARQLFIETYDGLGPLAEVRVGQLLGWVSPESAALARHHGAGSFRG